MRRGKLEGALESGYSLARMKYRVLLAPDAVEDLRRLRAYDRAKVQSNLAELQVNPRRVGPSRIKRLRGLRKPQYRLRVGEVRVFYDVMDEPEPTVEVLAIIAKKDAARWLEREGRKV